MRMQASPVTRTLLFVTKILVTGLTIFPYEHSSPVTGMKLERSRLVHLSNQAEISHMNSNKGNISAYYMSTEIYSKQSCELKMVCRNLETI